MRITMKDFIRKYNHIWVLLYVPLYVTWFFYLEQRSGISHVNIHCRLDDLIPFCEYFIIPYLLWFFYVALVFVCMFLDTKHKTEFYHYFGLMAAGMTFCLIIYTVWPNAQNLRPSTFERDNPFTRLIQFLYTTDTDTNVCPSLHVYNSLATHIAVCKGHFFQDKKYLKHVSFILCVLIILSTVFLKQHSCIDGIASFILFVIFYRLIWCELPEKKALHSC